MRYREVKKGMKVKVYRCCTIPKHPFVGAKGEVKHIHTVNSLFPLTVIVNIEGGKRTLFSHKELKKTK